MPAPSRLPPPDARGVAARLAPDSTPASCHAALASAGDGKTEDRAHLGAHARDRR